MDTIHTLLVTGIVLGLTAGFSPGPLMALVLGETLSRGPRAGVLVAMAPLITDAPIVALAWLVLARMNDSGPLLGVLALAGAVYLAKMGWETLTCGPVVQDANADTSALKKGILTNFLSPHPYLFWGTVGAPMLVRGSESGPLGPVLFLAGFYACLLGVKIFIALATARLRHLLRSTAYMLILRALGAALLFFAASFLLDGLRLIGLV